MKMRKRIFEFSRRCSILHSGVARLSPIIPRCSLDETVTKTLTGTVTDFELMNPHSLMSWDVKGADGKPQSWTGEAGHVRLMKIYRLAEDSLNRWRYGNL